MTCKTCNGAGFVKVYVWQDGRSAYTGPLALADDKVRWLTGGLGYKLAYCPACHTAAARHHHTHPEVA